jgi:hypothetical protein
MLGCWRYRLTPLALSRDVLVQVERDLILLELKLKFTKQRADNKRACLSTQFADLSLLDVLAS